MAIITSNSIPPELSTRLFLPLQPVLARLARQRTDLELSDQNFVHFGVLRALLDFDSGRHALQSLPERSNLESLSIARSTWFDALSSPTRLNILEQVDKQLFAALQNSLPDSLAHFPELDPYEIWSGDGHWHAAAVHDAKDLLKDTKIPVGHIYFTNHRTGLLRHHATCEAGTQEHDMSALGRIPISLLKGLQGARREKTLVVYDRASINFQYWNNAKNTKGIRLITRDKDGLKPEFVEILPYDERAPINARVCTDSRVRFAGKLWRRVVVEHASDPEKTITLLTNDLDLAPGLIGLLYHRRWDIERIFSVLKNGLNEKQAWATSQTAKTSQAHFICLAYNLTRALESQLEQEESIGNQAEQKRRDERTEQRIAPKTKRKEPLPQNKKSNASPSRVVTSSRADVLVKARHVTFSVKYLRWITDHLFQPIPWKIMLERLTARYATL